MFGLLSPIELHLAHIAKAAKLFITAEQADFVGAGGRKRKARLSTSVLRTMRSPQVRIPAIRRLPFRMSHGPHRAGLQDSLVEVGFTICQTFTVGSSPQWVV